MIIRSLVRFLQPVSVLVILLARCHCINELYALAELSRASSSINRSSAELKVELPKRNSKRLKNERLGSQTKKKEQGVGIKVEFQLSCHKNGL